MSAGRLAVQHERYLYHGIQVVQGYSEVGCGLNAAVEKLSFPFG